MLPKCLAFYTLPMLRGAGHREVSRWVVLIFGIVFFLFGAVGLLTGEVSARGASFDINDNEPTYAAGIMFHFVVSIGCFTGFWCMREKKNKWY